MLSEAVRTRLGRAEVSRLIIALSGGLDSVCLLHSVMAADLGKKICAIHVNHGLQPAASDFADYAELLCQRWQIELTVVAVKVGKAGSLLQKQAEGSIEEQAEGSLLQEQAEGSEEQAKGSEEEQAKGSEEQARVARYAAFEALLSAGDLLLLAQHADDQVETLLFRLFRGSRVPGLEGMPMERPLGRGRLYRPLLNIPRQNIHAYATTHSLEWRDDPTNWDTSFDRNWLRHRVIPLLEEGWPRVKATLLERLAQDQLRLGRLAIEAQETLATLSLAADQLDLARLQALDAACFNSVFDAWCNQLGLPLPSGHLLRELRGKLLYSAGGVIRHAGIELRPYQGCLYGLRPVPPPEHLEEPVTAGTRSVPGGVITQEVVQGAGLRADKEYQIRHRSGGEVLHIRHHRSLKKCLQEAPLPPWLRAHLPLIFCEQQLVAVAAVPSWHLPMLLADHWAAGATQPGWQISLDLKDRLALPVRP